MGFQIIEEVKPGWNKILDDNGQYYIASANYPGPGSTKTIYQKPVPIRKVTPEELWDRFTPDEQVRLANSNHSKINWFFRWIRIKTLINLDDPTLSAAIQEAESNGLLDAPGRAAEILS